MPLPYRAKGDMRPKTQEELRARIRSSYLINRLQNHADGEIGMTPTQIKAAEILLSKTLAGLQATEIHMIDDRDKMTDMEIIGKIAELLQREPQLAEVLQGRLPTTVTVIPTEIDEPGTDEPECPMCDGQGMDDGCPVCGLD